MLHAAKFGRTLPLCAVFGLSASPALPATAPVEVRPAPAPHTLAKEDLEAFFDGIIPLQLERSDVAGATVLVMHGSETLLQKGYGFSDLKPKQPVDPESTMFRLASISKLFTWTAAMQLVEQGKLDLDVDVGRYLDFPMRGAGTITLRNLMTHTTGFEETVRDIIVTDPKKYLPLREFLIQNQPQRSAQGSASVSLPRLPLQQPQARDRF
jgi:CubicO group peptidase (beta-lactamase class C family)